MNDPMKVAQSYTIDLATIARLSELQDATGLTRSALVRDAIAHYHEWYFNGRLSDTTTQPTE